MQCNRHLQCRYELFCSKNLEKSQTIRMISLFCWLIPSLSHSPLGKFPHRLPRSYTVLARAPLLIWFYPNYIDVVFSTLVRFCSISQKLFFSTGSLQIYFFYLFIALLACENKSKSVIHEDAVKQIIALPKRENIWIKLEPPRSYGQILSQPTSL